jgi:hypothetical protein
MLGGVVPGSDVESSFDRVLDPHPMSMLPAPCRALPVVHVLVDRINRVGSDLILGRGGESLYCEGAMTWGCSFWS